MSTIKYPTDFLTALNEGWEVCPFRGMIQMGEEWHVYIKHEKQDIEAHPIPIKAPWWLHQFILTERTGAVKGIQHTVKMALGILP